MPLKKTFISSSQQVQGLTSRGLSQIGNTYSISSAKRPGYRICNLVRSRHWLLIGLYLSFPRGLHHVRLTNRGCLQAKQLPCGRYLQEGSSVRCRRYIVPLSNIIVVTELSYFGLTDAAHVHSATGAQGLNSGVMDSVSLY